MKGKLQTFNDFLVTQKGTIDIGAFSVNMILAALLALVLYLLYVKCGRSLSNRREFGRNFMIISCTTMFIITVVKISLALSLGLVGALSIVRFRTAIKEPEELSYLFLSIAVGLGLGAGQRLVTIIAFVFITLLIVVRTFFGKVQSSSWGMLLQVTCDNGGVEVLKSIEKILAENCTRVELRRMDDSHGKLSMSYMIGFDSGERLGLIHEKLKMQDGQLAFTFMDTTLV